jgi:hypothetical protein
MPHLLSQGKLYLSLRHDFKHIDQGIKKASFIEEIARLKGRKTNSPGSRKFWLEEET